MITANGLAVDAHFERRLDGDVVGGRRPRSPRRTTSTERVAWEAASALRIMSGCAV